MSVGGASVSMLVLQLFVGLGAALHPSPLRPHVTARVGGPHMSPHAVDASGGEAQVWLQALTPFATLAFLQASSMLAVEPPAERSPPQRAPLGADVSRCICVAIIYSMLHSAGLGALPAHAADDELLAAAQRVSDTESLNRFGLGNAAKEGDIGIRPTLGGVNLFVYYAIYQVCFQIYLRTKNPGGANVALVNGTRVVDGRRDMKTPMVDAPIPGRSISPVLGGGKKTDDIKPSTGLEVGSLAASVLVLSALVYGAVNEDAVGDIAKESQRPCVEKIVRGKRLTCDSSSS